MVLQQEMESWSKFRRGLRLEDQQALDELFRAARLQLAGSAYAARPIPFESIVMSMLVMQHRRLDELQHSVQRLCEGIPPLLEIPPDREKEADGQPDDQRLAV
jgi:hypothetical protein